MSKKPGSLTGRVGVARSIPYIRCQCQILSIKWFDFVWNAIILQRYGRPPITHYIKKWHCMLFIHVTRMDKNTSEHCVLRLSILTQRGSCPDPLPVYPLPVPQKIMDSQDWVRSGNFTIRCLVWCHQPGSFWLVQWSIVDYTWMMIDDGLTELWRKYFYQIILLTHFIGLSRFEDFAISSYTCLFLGWDLNKFGLIGNWIRKILMFGLS